MKNKQVLLSVLIGFVLACLALVVSGDLSHFIVNLIIWSLIARLIIGVLAAITRR